jgi:HPt (histidine-containing phosphotransfer) domain-containing protein
MNDYVTKPVSAQALAEALAKWLPGEETARLTAAYARPITAARVAVEPATAEEPETPLFDLSGMLARLMDDEDLARSVVHGFLEDIPRQIEALGRYLDAGDAEGAADQAHKLKGASANVGGESLREAAFEIEKAATAGRLAEALASLPDLESRFARLKQAMQDFADEKRPARSGKS